MTSSKTASSVSTQKNLYSHIGSVLSSGGHVRHSVYTDLLF